MRSANIIEPVSQASGSPSVRRTTIAARTSLISGCRAEQFVGFLGGGDAARLGQEGGDGLTVERLRWIHAGTVVVDFRSGPQEFNGSNA